MTTCVIVKSDDYSFRDNTDFFRKGLFFEASEETHFEQKYRVMRT